MNDAIWMRPSVSVGSTAWRTRDVTSPSRPYSLSPDGGKRCQPSEKSRMSMMPSQKLGNETPKSDTADPRVSQTLPRRTAASTPSGTATAIAKKQRARRELQRGAEAVDDERRHGGVW